MDFNQFKKLIGDELQAFRIAVNSSEDKSSSRFSNSSIQAINLPEYEFQTYPNESNWRLGSILALHDHVFVNASYMALLGRPADANGMEHHLALIRSGKLDKIGVLARLYVSKEARVNRKNRKFKIPLHIVCWSLIKQVPVIGFVASWMQSFLTLPNLQKQVNENLAHSLALHVHLQTYLRDSSTEVSKALNSLANASTLIEKRLNELGGDVSECLDAQINKQTFDTEILSDIKSGRESINKLINQCDKLESLINEDVTERIEKDRKSFLKLMKD
ncbi:DUF4214 domain-containing protein [Pseudoalteromonas sp. GB56]